MRFVLTRHNIKNLPLLGDFLAKNGVALATLAMTATKEKLPRFVEAWPFIDSLLGHERDFKIALLGLPYCAVPDQARDHLFRRNKVIGEKTAACAECKFDAKCQGFPSGYLAKFGADELRPQVDAPLEVVIEAEVRCNFDCSFCFNKISFAKEGRSRKNISSAKIRKIIDDAASVGVKSIRFTGGEPLLRSDLLDLCRYAKGRGVSVKLNTNGSLVTEDVANRLKGAVDNVLISLENGEEEAESATSGQAATLQKKVRAIRILKKAGIPIVRIGTVFTKEGIDNFENIAAIAEKEQVFSWEWYRPMGGRNNIEPRDVEELIKKMARFRSASPIPLQIANPLPFCSAADPRLLNALSMGAVHDEGNSRLVADPRGFFKPDYFIDKQLAALDDLAGAWQHVFMKEMRALAFLPATCSNCFYKEKCRGGSRHEAFLAHGKWDAPDPLANIKNKERII